MIYLYDKAIVKDLEQSFNPDNVENPAVRVIDPEGIIGLAAQIQNDDIKFPIVALSRNADSGVNQDLMNFTRLHSGVAAVFDKETNNIYQEKVIPLKLSYTMSILTTNVIDMDEIIKELIFKYTQMYFLRIKLPYECKRTIRFGVVIPPETTFETKSKTFEYLSAGKLYETDIPLQCQGCVLVYYTPQHLTRISHEVEPTLKSD